MSFLPNKRQPVFTILSYGLPVVILVIVWAFPLFHYYVPNVLITDHAIAAARYQPDDSVLDEIIRFFQLPENKTGTQLDAEARQILQGKLDLSGLPSTSFTFPFNPYDLDKNGSKWQLRFASLALPERLLNTYQVTGNTDYLLGAKEIISEFARYERNSWLPRGFLWNDHAVAARISVLVKFWKLYRNHSDYEPEVAINVLRLVARSARLLAKPAHFTFATNHGIMQNLALLQVCIAFPSLPNLEFHKRLAFDRMQGQMHFYINDEGVVLEHSAGYQRVGLKFMGMAFRYLTLLNMPIPEEWKIKYQKAEAFYTQLLRPDNSLPLLGDTSSWREIQDIYSGHGDVGKERKDVVARETSIQKRSYSLYPVAGYSIWWNGFDERQTKDKMSQTVVTWSYFPGHAHKHADEMSVLLWARGYNWWTNTGYWPYGTKGRKEALSWAGSNAPHLTNESRNSRRQTRLLGHGWSDGLAAIDLERKGTNDYLARRQVIRVNPNLWIVLDHTFGNDGQHTTTTWTTSHNINLNKSELPGSYSLETKDSNVTMTKFIFTSKGANIKQVKGSFSPFAGWENQKPAPAIVVEQPANDSWAAAVWSLEESDKESHKFNDTPLMTHWKSPENWQMKLPLASGSMTIRRENQRIWVQHDANGAGVQKALQISKPPQITDQRTEIHAAFENADRKYPLKKYSINRHVKATYLIIILFLFQEAFFLIYGKSRRKSYNISRGISVFGWIAAGAWLFTVYL